MILDVNYKEDDRGILRIGSPPEDLPGIVNSVKISGSLLFETAEVQGRSGRVKIVQGWDDADLTITMTLIDNQKTGETRWDFLEVIANVFKKVADNGKPEIYTISHPLVGAWGTSRFLFSSLDVTENRTRHIITVSLEFLEYDSYARVKQERQDSSNKSKPAGNVTPPVSDKDRAGLGKTEQRFVKQS
jgi:hypothetical protein